MRCKGSNGAIPLIGDLPTPLVITNIANMLAVRTVIRTMQAFLENTERLCRLLSSSGQDSPLKQPIDNHDANRPELECTGDETAVE